MSRNVDEPLGQLVFLTDAGERVPYTSPRDKWQLQRWLQLLFNITVTEKSVCSDHQAPLDAVAASYFAEAPVIVWKGSRGFAGKTTLLAALSMLEILDGANVNLLGGSGQQSRRVHEVERDSWNNVITIDGQSFETPLRHFIPREPTTWSTNCILGNKLIALTASTKSARGPHPQRLRIDEADEMKQLVFDAAMGQAMDNRGIKAQTTISSTKQYPDGTMDYVEKLAKDRGWPTYEWCVSGDTLISTPTGDYKIKDMLVGSEVLAYDNGNIVTAKASNIWRVDKRETYRIITDKTTIIATAEHKFLTTKGWRRLDSISQDTRLLLPSMLKKTSKFVDVAIVKRIEYNGMIDVWDMTVPKYYNFIANGLVAHNCYRESRVENGGWLTDEQIEEKKDSVSSLMWNIEYEMQEPVAEGRLFEAEALLELFRPRIGTVNDKLGAYYEFEKPRPGASYSTAADWARDVDKTVIVTLRYDVYPVRLAAYERVNKEPYPLMVKRFDRRLERYPSEKKIHDATGVGSVISDYIDNTDVINYNTKKRADLFSDYIIGVEAGRIQAPMLKEMHTEHKFARYTDIYGTGHPPDTMVAMALAYLAIVGEPEGKKDKKPGHMGRSRNV